VKLRDTHQLIGKVWLLCLSQFISSRSFSATSDKDMAPVSLPLSLSHQHEVKTKPKVKCKALKPTRRSMFSQ